jgi:hypothetical protein
MIPSSAIHMHMRSAAKHLFTHGAPRTVVRLPRSGFVQRLISDTDTLALCPFRRLPSYGSFDVLSDRDVREG